MLGPALEPHSNRTLNRCAFKVYRYVASGLLVEQETTSSAFFDAVLAPLGGKRLMDFGEVIGYGLAGRSFWLGPVTTGREAARGASRSRPPAGRRSRPSTTPPWPTGRRCCTRRRSAGVPRRVLRCVLRDPDGNNV